MSPHVRCSRCRRWCSVSSPGDACYNCQTRLDADLFEEVVELDRQALARLQADPAKWYGEADEVLTTYERIWALPTCFHPMTPKP